MSEEALPYGDLRILPSGVELTRITNGRFDIVTGEWNPFVSGSLKFDPGATTEKIMLSGEALVFPRNNPATLIFGRYGSADVEIDPDFVPRLSTSSDEQVDLKYAGAVDQLDAALKKAGLGGLNLVVDVGDNGISRHQLQLSRHPDGVTMVAYSPAMGKRHYEKDVSRLNVQGIVGGPQILRNYKEEVLVQQLRPTFSEGAQILNSGDVVIIRGTRRTICLRFLDSVDVGELQFKPAKLIKQSYPKDISLEGLHREIIIGIQKGQEEEELVQNS